MNIIMAGILTVNCQGLGDLDRRKDVSNYLKQKNLNIHGLQNTHFTKELEPYIQTQWGFRCLFSSFSGNARGVAIFLIYDIMQHTECHKIPRMLVLVDFEKVFSSLAWFFIEQSESRILQNGFCQRALN